MSMLKKIANYCRKSNEKEEAYWKSYDQIKSHNYDVEVSRKESRRCCTNCVWACGYCSMCGKHGYMELDDPYNTVCRDFQHK